MSPEQKADHKRDHWKDAKVAEYFDITDQYESDLPFYKALTSENRTFLELGVGTGRVAIEMAKEGAQVTGIDFSRAMLDVAERKAEDAGLEGSLELIEGDMRSFNLHDKSFDVAYIPYYSFGYLYTVEDQTRCLRAVHRHLKQDGQLIVHMFQPNPSYFSSLALGRIGGSVLEDAGYLPMPSGNSLLVSSATRYDRATQELTANVVFEELSPAGECRKFVIPLTTHVYYRYELELLLRTSGFEVLDVYGDFDGSPLASDSWDMVFVNRKGEQLGES